MMRKLALTAVVMLTLVGIATAATPTIFASAVYMDWSLAGASGIDAPVNAPYLYSKGSAVMDTFLSAHGQFKDTWVLSKPLYDVVLYTDSATKQVGIWMNRGGTMPTVVQKDSTGLFIPGRVDTIFTYRLAADTAGSEIFFAKGKPTIPKELQQSW